MVSKYVFKTCVMAGVAISAVFVTSCKRIQASEPTTSLDSAAVSLGNMASPAKKEKKFSWKPPVYDTTKQYIYLTFDDGPQPGTSACFNLCKQLGIKATFFMVGEHAEDKRPKKLVDSIRNSYPEILLANHSYTHASNKYKYFYEHAPYANTDFARAQDSLKVPFMIARLPGNNAWVRTGEVKGSPQVTPLCHLLDTAGFNVIGWDVEWHFAPKTANPVQSADQMIATIESVLQHKTHTRNHIMILTHDRMFRHPNYTDSLAKVITALKQNPRYVFETADNYPGLRMQAQ